MSNIISGKKNKLRFQVMESRPGYLTLVVVFVNILSNAWSHARSNEDAEVLRPGSRSKHGRIVRRIPRSFSRRPCTPSLPCSHGRCTRPAIASIIACLRSSEGKTCVPNARSPVNSSKAIIPTAQISTAVSTTTDLQPASSACTVSGAA